MLKHEDGFPHKNPSVNHEVKHLQRLLRLIFDKPIAIDGLFGRKTEKMIFDVQQHGQLQKTGIVDDATWRVIESTALSAHAAEPTDAKLSASQRSQTTSNLNDDRGKLNLEKSAIDHNQIDGFRGSLERIHRWEGHAGKAYWPGGNSGVTLDPGYDLGQQPFDRTLHLYRDILDRTQLRAAEDATGLRGQQAKRQLRHSSELVSIRVSRSQALSIFPILISPYWLAITQRFPALTNTATPPEVQTALLSLAFNRGPSNLGLVVLKPHIQIEDWLSCSREISAMQQDHQLRGIRQRRREEAELIKDALS
ncbi:peptidoglycan-binding protein [bacterium SCSIO 12696]|nr:peptidoglycan-binding protein [bacterium SCSIO 12696]